MTQAPHIHCEGILLLALTAQGGGGLAHRVSHLLPKVKSWLKPRSATLTFKSAPGVDFLAAILYRGPSLPEFAWGLFLFHAAMIDLEVNQQYLQGEPVQNESELFHTL